MSEVKILGASVPNVPWQEDPKEFHGERSTAIL